MSNPLSRLLAIALVAILFTTAAALPQEAPPLQRPLDPAGDVVLGTDGRMAEGALPVAIPRSPDTGGPDGGGRYLVVVNSGYGSEVSRQFEHARQSLQVIDLNASPAPVVVQEVYFPSPQSANVGLAFGGTPSASGAWPLYVSGGVQNHVWRFTFTPGVPQPIAPANEGPTTPVGAPSIDVTSAASAPGAKYYNGGVAPAYPTGLAIGRTGTLYVAANLGDALAVVQEPERAPRVHRIDLHREAAEGRFLYPYDVRVVQDRSGNDKVYVSLWNDDAVAVVDGERRRVQLRIPTGAHPSALAVNGPQTRLAVVNANADTVSIIDTRLDKEVERVAIGLGGGTRLGNSPQALVFSESGRTLLVANAQSQSVAVVALSRAAAGLQPSGTDWDDKGEQEESDRSRVLGYIPTARYPSALAVVGSTLFVGNGKGEPAARSNAPNDAFPPNHALRGAYSAAVVGGSLRRVTLPDPQALAAMTNRVLAANGLVGEPRTSLFGGPSPIRHVIYVIKENRTYDQVFGDLAASGDGSKADGEPSLAIFGAGAAARRGNGPPQDITPNHRALALRFGLFDRFFVNSEASPDGHAWATSAFSTEYVDKAFRWQYSGRGRTYDYEGFNRLPDLDPANPLPPPLKLPLTVRDVSAFLKRYVPYLNGSRDVAEPESLYLWDAAAKAGLSYRTYGEFVSTLSSSDVDSLNEKRSKRYPDVSPNVDAFATKASLEGHFSTTFRNFDLTTPDAITTEGYSAARADATIDPMVRARHADVRVRGASRIGAWLDDFEQHVADLASGAGDHLSALTILRLPNDHTAGMAGGNATPQFLVADNDYALGRLVQAVSGSPYWRDTAIMVLEDDAQDGPDHVDAHRSPALVISAYNRRGALIHSMHNTVSLIRTLELLIGIAPMNTLDAAAIPMDVFTDTPDLTPYAAVLPDISLDNLIVSRQAAVEGRRLQDASARQDLQNPDMADPAVLNAAIWYSVRGSDPMPPAGRLAAVDAMQTGIDVEGEESARQPLVMARLALRKQLHRR